MFPATIKPMFILTNQKLQLIPTFYPSKLTCLIDEEAIHKRENGKVLDHTFEFAYTKHFQHFTKFGKRTLIKLDHHI